MVIIALCGQKRVGKDTVAEFLCETRGFRHVKFTEPLKEGLCSFFGFTPEQIEGPDKDAVDPTWGITPRRVMQWMGTDIMQFEVSKILPDVGRKFWAMQLVNKIKKGQLDRVVISDLRFVHEHECLKQAFGEELVTVRIVRPSEGGGDDAHNHLSELEVDSIAPDFVVYNTGPTPADMLDTVWDTVWRILAGAPSQLEHELQLDTCMPFDKFKSKYNEDGDVATVLFGELVPGLIDNTDTVTPGLDVDYTKDNRIVSFDVWGVSKRANYPLWDALDERGCVRYDKVSDRLTIRFDCQEPAAEMKMEPTDDERIFVGVKNDGSWDRVVIARAMDSIVRRPWRGAVAWC